MTQTHVKAPRIDERENLIPFPLPNQNAPISHARQFEGSTTNELRKSKSWRAEMPCLKCKKPMSPNATQKCAKCNKIDCGKCGRPFRATIKTTSDKCRNCRRARVEE